MYLVAYVSLSFILCMIYLCCAMSLIESIFEERHRQAEKLHQERMDRLQIEHERRMKELDRIFDN